MASTSSRARLTEFLLGAFTAEELRRFVRFGPEGDRLVHELPDGSVSPATFADTVVEVLLRRGLVDEELFQRLSEARPRRAREVRALQVELIGERGPAPASRELKQEERPVVVVLCDGDGIAAVDVLRRHIEGGVRRGRFELHIIHVDEWSLELGILIGSLCLVLLTPGLLDGERAQERLRELMAAHRKGLLRAVPVLAVPTRWRTTALGRLSPLPANGIPISTWTDADAAWAEVVQGVLRALASRETAGSHHEGVSSAPRLVAPTTGGQIQVLPISDIFRTVGPPDVNFVAPAQLPDLVLRMKAMSEGLVVEGPSGVGKTTATRQALRTALGGDDLEALVSAGKVHWLSSKRDEDLVRLRAILDAGDRKLRGHLVLDDFHRLEAPLQARVAAMMKLIADEGAGRSKVVVVGINPVGYSLVREFPDLGGRFEVISMGKQPDEKIDELIEKGERAANISFDKRPELVKASRGSFYMAQLLCLEAARRDGISETQRAPRVVVSGPDGVILDKVLARLKFKFHEALLGLASHDEAPPPRGACLSLLWLIAQSFDNSISLVAARARYPELGAAFDWLLGSKLAAYFAAHPRLSELFFYNRDSGILSAEDPQLDFYLQNLNWPAFARDSGHILDWDPQGGFRSVAARDAVVVAAAPQPTPKTKLPRSRVLHLSDLHFGTQEQAVLWYDQLFSDLRSELACDRLDAVILSGDVTNRAASDEFDAASAFLRDLKEDFGLGPHQVVIVPGNHDLSWAVSQQAYKVKRRKDHTEPLVPGRFVDKGEFIEVPDEIELRARFKAFADFYYSVRTEAYSLDCEDQATVHFFADRKLLVLGLNSAWSIDHEFRDRADIHAVALGRALRGIQREPIYVDALKIAVFHHPVTSPDQDRLRDTGFVERLAQAGFRLALHGHVHEAQQGLFRYDMSASGRRVDFLGAGTFGAPTREWVPGIPLQYQLLEFEDDRLKVHTRRRENPSGAWKPDARWLQGAGKNPLPFYELDL